jgi:hypothetical protein
LNYLYELLAISSISCWQGIDYNAKKISLASTHCKYLCCMWNKMVLHFHFYPRAIHPRYTLAVNVLLFFGKESYTCTSTTPSNQTYYLYSISKYVRILFLELNANDYNQFSKILWLRFEEKKANQATNKLSFIYFIQGLVEEDKLNSFNLPMYGPSVDEVKAAASRLGCLTSMKLNYLN